MVKIIVAELLAQAEPTTVVIEMLYGSSDGRSSTDSDVVFVIRFLTTSPDIDKILMLNEKLQLSNSTDSHDKSRPLSVGTADSWLGIGSCAESVKDAKYFEWKRIEGKGVW